jgi:cell division protein FtsA
LGKKDRYIAGIDIGSTKTCALIAEVEESAVKFVSLGVAESRGLRKGQIVNIDGASSAVRHAVEEAEAGAGVPVETAVLGVAGAHVRGVNSRGGFALGGRGRDVLKEDVRRAVEAARNITLPEDREILHVLPQEFFLDGQDSIRDPVGMLGQKLEANVHLVTSSAIATQNMVTAVNRAGIRVTDTILEPLAAAEACLSADERELGCCLLDIGGGTAECIVYFGGVVKHTGAIPVGGDHFTNDLAVGLRTPIPEAEHIKRKWGCASRDQLREDAPIEIASVGDRPPRTIFASMLCDIVEPRAREFLTLVEEELRRTGVDNLIPAGLVLAGGAARLRGLAEMAERMFSLPVRVAIPRGVEGLAEEVLKPEFAAAVGLVLYGARARQALTQRNTSLGARLKSLFAGG